MDLSHPAAAVLLEYHEAVDKDMTPFTQKKEYLHHTYKLLNLLNLQTITGSSNFIDKEMEGK